MLNLTKEWKQPPAVILQQAILAIYLFCAKNHQETRFRCLVHEFFSMMFFNDINYG